MAKSIVNFIFYMFPKQHISYVSHLDVSEQTKEFNEFYIAEVRIQCNPKSKDSQPIMICGSGFVKTPNRTRFVFHILDFDILLTNDDRAKEK